MCVYVYCALNQKKYLIIFGSFFQTEKYIKYKTEHFVDINTHNWYISTIRK